MGREDIPQSKKSSGPPFITADEGEISFRRMVLFQKQECSSFLHLQADRPMPKTG